MFISMYIYISIYLYIYICIYIYLYLYPAIKIIRRAISAEAYKSFSPTGFRLIFSWANKAGATQCYLGRGGCKLLGPRALPSIND